MSDASETIDLVHLARQSLGDRALETELLALFERQAHQIIDRLCEIPRQMGAGGTGHAHMLAHTLKGSALAVGARRVASAAEAYENAADGQDSEVQILALRIAVDEARRAVAHLLAA